MHESEKNSVAICLRLNRSLPGLVADTFATVQLGNKLLMSGPGYCV